VPTLKRLPRTRLSDQAAAELKRLIANGTYGAGAKLPTEVELAEALGVTRLTVREALSHLEAAGLTSTRHGSGTYVTDFESQATLDLMALLLGAGKKLSTEENVSLMEFRRIVVGGFGAALAKRVRDEDIEDLEAVVAEERTQLGKPRVLAELDYRFNEILARASGNLFYTLLMRSVRAIHIDLGSVIFAQVKDDAVIVETHAAIVKALASRSSAKLEKCLALYLDGGSAVIQAVSSAKKKGKVS
jgi:GntR family transcriptional repressor for pyruvate dehydrogenase complex